MAGWWQRLKAFIGRTKTDVNSELHAELDEAKARAANLQPEQIVEEFYDALVELYGEEHRKDIVVVVGDWGDWKYDVQMAHERGSFSPTGLMPGHHTAEQMLSFAVLWRDNAQKEDQQYGYHIVDPRAEEEDTDGW